MTPRSGLNSLTNDCNGFDRLADERPSRWPSGKAVVVCLFVDWLLNVPVTCECISGTDLLRQLYVLPH